MDWKPCILLPKNEAGENHLEGGSSPYREEDYDTFSFPPADFEASYPLLRAINEVAGTDLDFGEEDVIPKEAVPAALDAVARCAAAESNAFRGQLLSILRAAADRPCSVAFFC